MPVTDLFFRSLFAFFIIELKKRRVIHVGVTRHPTDAWVAEPLREATPYGKAPRFLIRDNDSKFGPLFVHMASNAEIEVLKTPFHAPRANAYCERFLGSVRRECLDHLLILHEQQLFRVLQAYVAYFNQARPHQGLKQQIPDSPAFEARDGPILPVPFLGGLHTNYRRIAKSAQAKHKRLRRTLRLNSRALGQKSAVLWRQQELIFKATHVKYTIKREVFSVQKQISTALWFRLPS